MHHIGPGFIDRSKFFLFQFRVAVTGLILFSALGTATPVGDRITADPLVLDQPISITSQLEVATILRAQVDSGDVTGRIVSTPLDTNQVAPLADVNLGASYLFATGGSARDEAKSLAKTADGGYILAGDTSSFGAGLSDILLLKYNADGMLQWAKTAGGTEDDFARSVVQTNDGGYILTGFTDSYGAGNEDFLLTKLASDGSLTWARTAGGSDEDYGYSVIQSNDGGYIVAGNTNSYGASSSSDVLLLEYDYNGTLTRAITFGGEEYVTAASLQQTSDGGYIIAGKIADSVSFFYDVLLIKCESDFDIEWAVTAGGTSDDVAHSVVQTSDHGYILSGLTMSYGAGEFDFLLIKFAGDGSLTWARTAGGSDNDYGYSVIQTNDGGYILAGYTLSYGTWSDSLLVKFAGDGSLTWARTVGGSAADAAYSVIQSNDGGYILAGYTNSYGAGHLDIILMKTNSDGKIDDCAACATAPVLAYTPYPITSSQVLSTSTPDLFTSSPEPGTTSPDPQIEMICGTGNFLLASGGDNVDHAESVIQTVDGGYVITGRTNSYGAGGDDVLLTKYARDGSLTWARTAGGSQDDFAYSVTQGYDGGYIVAGVTYSYGAGKSDVLLLKYDRHGTLSWARTIGGSNYDYAQSVIEMTDGTIVLVGASNSFDANFVVLGLEFSSNGTLSSAFRIPGVPDAEATSVIHTDDGGFVIAGYTESYSAGGYDVMLLKFLEDWAGPDWAVVFGGSADDRAYEVAETLDHGFVVTGFTQSSGAGGADILVLKFTSNGALEWARTAGGSLNDWAFSVAQSPNGGYIVGGLTFSYGAGDYDGMLLKYAENGTLNWARTMGGNQSDRVQSLSTTIDGGYILTGRTESFGAGNGDVLMVKVDANGDIADCPQCVLVSPSTAVLTLSLSDISSNYMPLGASVNLSSPDPNISYPAPENFILCDGYYHAYLPVVVR